MNGLSRLGHGMVRCEKYAVVCHGGDVNANEAVSICVYYSR